MLLKKACIEIVSGCELSREILDLTLKIYDTIADQQLWSPMLDQLVDRIGAQGSIIFDWPQSAGERKLTAPLHSGYYPSKALGVYLARYQHLEARDQEIIRPKINF